MRVSLILLFILLAINLAVDWYIVTQINKRCKQPRLWRSVELCSVGIMILLLIGAMAVPARSGGNDVLLTKMWLLFSYLSLYIPKLIADIFDLLASIPRLLGHKRIKALTLTGIILAVATFIGMWWGALVNRFNIDTREVEITFDNIPEEFDGYRVVQFSDLHTGTFGSDTTFVSRLVDHINTLNPDLIVFTGDIVNRRSDEFTPFVPVLRRLSARDGVIAILGNHDYGDYNNWPSDSAKQANMTALYDAYSHTGIRLLLNETAWIHRSTDSIAIIGVENIGDPPFHVYGSLPASYSDTSDPNFKILLSHNPAHWVDSIARHDDINIPLTLAGHTHAMQIELFGVSPAYLRYKTWGGLYADYNNRHRLYVNIGSGTVGMPMRLGATPEVTVFTLRRDRQPLSN